MVLGQGRRPPGGDHRVEVEIGGSPVGGGQLGPGQGEGGAHFDQRHHCADGGLDRAQGAAVDGVDPSDVDGRVLPTQRPGEVHQPPRRQVVLQRAAGFGVDLCPPVVGDRGQLSHQMVHGSVLLSFRRLPMPRLPSAARAWANGLGTAGPTRVRVLRSMWGKGWSRSGMARTPSSSVRPGAFRVNGHVHPIAEGAEGLIEEGVGEDAVDLGADLGADLELGGIRLGGAAGQQHLAPGDAQGEDDRRWWPVPRARTPPGRGTSPPLPGFTMWVW